MDTFILLVWTAAGAVLFVNSRLVKVLATKYYRGHWLPALVALAGLVMFFAYCIAALDFIEGGWPSLRAWIAAAIYIALACATVRAIGAGDAAPLLKRIKPSPRTIPGVATKLDARAKLPPSASETTDKVRIEL